jgi:PadR family transcriptional regulator AphA
MNVRTLCLGVLNLGDASGYEIKKAFEAGPFAHFHQAGFGSIYPALGGLHEDGCVSFTEVATDRRPAKKVYAITEKGRTAFRQALTKWPAPDKIRSEFVFMLFFADLMEEDHLDAVYDAYLAHYRRHVEQIRGLDSTGIAPGRLFARGFGLAFYEAAVQYLETNRALLLDQRAAEAGQKTGTDR